jgi:hypothetical protein
MSWQVKVLLFLALLLAVIAFVAIADGDFAAEARMLLNNVWRHLF